MADVREAQGCAGQLTFTYQGKKQRVDMLVCQIETKMDGPYYIGETLGLAYARSSRQTRITISGILTPPPAKKRFTPAGMEAD